MTAGRRPLSQEERRRIVAHARRLRSEAIASLFRAAGRGIARLFGGKGRAPQGTVDGSTEPSAARA